MLKEVYLIDNGILMFHYARGQKESDSDEAILSSGLLSAINTFSQNARANMVQSFYTENEYFLFINTRQSGMFVVGIFERKAPEKVANDTMVRIRDLLEEVELPDETGRQLSNEKKEEIRRDIDKIILQMFGEREIEAYAEELLSQREDIPLAFIVDIITRRPILHFARPKALYREELVRDFLLVHDTLTRVLSRLAQSEQYSHFVISAAGYTIAACWSGTLLSVTSGSLQTDRNTVLDMACQLCHCEPLSEPVIDQGSKTITRFRILKNSSVTSDIGEPPQRIFIVSISTLVNNLDALIKQMTHRNFESFGVIFGKRSVQTMTIINDRNGVIEVNIAENIYQMS